MEQLIDFHAPEVQAVLDTLLKDKSTGKNIIWVTDLAKGQLVNEVWAAKDDTVEPAIALEGEHKVAEDGFTEFYPTEASIQKAVLTLFWEPFEE